MPNAVPFVYWPSCPRCRQKLAVTPACPGCGLALRVLDEVYGEREVVVERVNDPDGYLDAAGREHLEGHLVRHEAQFPQSFVVVYIGTLGSAAAVRQFGFWLLNRAVPRESDAMRPNENGVVLAIDAAAQVAGLTVGYQIEPWLSEQILGSVLAGGRRNFRRGRIGQGAAQVVVRLGDALRTALREPSRSGGPRWPLFSALTGLPRLHTRRGVGFRGRIPRAYDE